MLLCYPIQKLTDEQEAVVKKVIPDKFKDYYDKLKIIIVDDKDYQTLLENHIPVSKPIKVKTLDSIVIPEEIETFITSKLIQKLIEDAFSDPDRYFSKQLVYEILDNYKQYLELNRIGFISLDPKKDLTYEITGFWESHGIVTVSVVKPNGDAYTFTMEIPVAKQTYYFPQDVPTPIVNINSFNTSTIDYSEIAKTAEILYKSGIAYKSFFNNKKEDK